MNDHTADNTPSPDEHGSVKLDDLFTPGLFRKRDGTSYNRPLNKTKSDKAKIKNQEDKILTEPGGNI